jgi:hypothetical protein
MKLRIAIALGLALAFPATTLAATSVAWTRQFGSIAEDAAGGIAADEAGITVVGTTAGAIATRNRGYVDIVLRRYTPEGAVLWTRQFGTTNQDYGQGIAADPTGLTVLGATDGSFTGGTGTLGLKDIVVRRYDRAGTAKWTRQFGTSVDEDPGDIAADATTIAVTGTTYGALQGTNAPDDADAFLRRYSSAGAVMWTRQFGTTSGDSATAVSVDSAGITVGGKTHGAMGGANSGGFPGDAFIRRFSLTGQTLWTQQWGQRGSDAVLSLTTDSTGITAVGYTYKDAQGNEPSQAYIRRFDLSGNPVFYRIFGTENSDVAWGVAADAAGLTVTGYTYGSLESMNQGTFDVFVRRYNRTGAVIYRHQFGTTGADLGLDVAADAAGFSVLGHTNGDLVGTNKGELDLFVKRFLR